MATCDATMTSVAVENHTHTCNGHHDDGCHYCPGCGYYWWERASGPLVGYAQQPAETVVVEKAPGSES